MQKKIKANCPVCGKAFVKKTDNQKYCSAKCKAIMKNKAKRIARVCGKKVEKKPVAKKATTKKPVALKEKITLPKKPTAKPTVHLVKPGDVIAWSKEVGPARIMAYAISLQNLVISDILTSIKAAKTTKKTTKKTAKK